MDFRIFNSSFIGGLYVLNYNKVYIKRKVKKVKVLFINACLRGQKSRTLRLCNKYLEALKLSRPDVEIEEIDLETYDLEVQSGEYINRREVFLKKLDFSDKMFDEAKRLIAADHIVIGAPYWDLSFPAKLKVYLERCSVDKLTFIYDEKGVPHGQCKAKALTYITTAGGFIGDMNFGFDYVKGLCSFLFGIKEFHFAAADGIDIIGIDAEAKLSEAEHQLEEIAGKI